jgi:aminoglycoside phosphotransferase (APT) family kinase protein
MEYQEREIPERLLGFLNANLPARENLQLSDLLKIGNGWETDVFTVMLSYDLDRQRRYEQRILRIYPGSDGVGKSAKEFKAMRRLREMGYPVPQVFVLEETGAALGRPFMLMEKINGQLLGSTFDKAPLEKKRELLSLFCRLFVQLHGLDYRPFLENGVTIATPQVYIMQRLDWLSGWVCSLLPDEFDPILNWLRDRGAQIQWKRLSLIHLDYHGGNILLRDDGAPFVIDWGQVEVADYRFDLAWTLLLSSGYGNPQARETILGEYERVAGCPVEEIGYFDAWAATRRLFSIVASVRGGAEKLGMRPGAEQVMLRNTRHIRLLYSIMQDRTGLRLPKIEEWLAALP